MENRAKFGIIHIYRRSVAWEEAGLGIAEEVNSRRVAKFGETCYIRVVMKTPKTALYNRGSVFRCHH